MIALKKASIQDIISSIKNNNDPFEKEIGLLDHYKDFELYLSNEDLSGLVRDGKIIEGGSIKEIQNVLKANNAQIRAVHCPMSRKVSGNYLSLEESIIDEESFCLLENTIVLADKLSNNIPVIILHAGSWRGCLSDTEQNSDNYPEVDDDRLKEYSSKLSKISNESLEHRIRIAIENITPYYDDENPQKGKNGGWGYKYQNNEINWITRINDIINTSKDFQADRNQNPKIEFGYCIDFCHLMADYHLVKDKGFGIDAMVKASPKCSDYIKIFFEKLDNDLVFLFHLSNYNSVTGNHGELFQYSNTNDEEMLELIRDKCSARKYADIPVTLEMKGGEEIEKGIEYFDSMVYQLSIRHRQGILAVMIKNNESGLYDFFEDLFWIYAVPIGNRKALHDRIYKLKKYVMENTPQKMLFQPEKKEYPENLFGFSWDEQKIDIPRIRLKAYVFYMRYCTLGEYLAGIYDKAEFLSNKEEDFCRSMLYFMFCDAELKLCEYTGIAYSFNVDFLPKEKNLYRLNDEIDSNDKGFNPNIEINGANAFKDIFRRIKNQISGRDFTCYSLGDKFNQCFFKYYNSKYKDWNLRIYNKMPVNYITVDDISGKECNISIPAFLQKYIYSFECDVMQSKERVSAFSFDVSRFKKGIGRENSKETDVQTDVKTDAFFGFLKYVTGEALEAKIENFGNVADGETVCTRVGEWDESLRISQSAARAYVRCERTIHKDLEKILSNELPDPEKKVNEKIVTLNLEDKEIVEKLLSIEKKEGDIINLNNNTYKGNEELKYELYYPNVKFMLKDSSENPIQ